MLRQLQQEVFVQPRRQTDVGFRQFPGHELFGVVNKRRQLRGGRKLDGSADVAHEAVQIVFAGFAVKPTRLAETWVVDEIADYAFHEILAVDKN